ncbi:tyrosine-type recombinase/integrase [Priestia endophytica]|uniref:tyrosine-type recombinase/integrase n=1 Tax=Priestia endophytica TaxID=135735 RepID=UPI000DCA936F|nr:tyrosine-type recombinase/integrase [Priestia endophytica]RAS80766.1 site-specific integrase [Priestia endophytica]
MSREKNVQPIRSVEEIQKMKDSLLRYCSYRDYFLFVFGINVGLRISDMLPLRVRDVRDKTHIRIKERKTNNMRIIYIDKMLRQEIDRYTYPMNEDDLLFPSRKGNSHITATQVYRTLQKAAEMVGVKNVGSRTLRKTFGYHHYKTYNDIEVLQEIFNHSNPEFTKLYIGIDKDESEKTLKDFSL